CKKEEGVEAEGCGNNIVVNIEVGGKNLQIYIKQENILSMIESKRFRVIKSDDGNEILKNYKVKVMEKGVNIKLIILIIAFFVVSHHTYYRLLERFAKYSQQENALLPMIKMLETRDPYTAGHSKRVATVAREFAKEIGIKGKRLRIIYKAALLHDIGKIGIPEKILLKPEKLLSDEFEVIKRHPIITNEILRTIPGYSEIARIARYHHERCDGKGYPYKLKCDEIPLETKIIILSDVYDALTSERPYRKSWSPKKALRYILENAGTQFDPELAKKFVKFMEEKYLR
ncbi:MAG: HD-GYP domain-containing protein, partial [Thermotogaceae bacterium]|nr:HD-GYP domain-containing protein [Thermotogaceae bacterium]